MEHGGDFLVFSCTILISRSGSGTFGGKCQNIECQPQPNCSCTAGEHISGVKLI